LKSPDGTATQVDIGQGAVVSDESVPLVPAGEEVERCGVEGPQNDLLVLNANERIKKRVEDADLRRRLRVSLGESGRVRANLKEGGAPGQKRGELALEPRIVRVPEVDDEVV